MIVTGPVTVQQLDVTDHRLTADTGFTPGYDVPGAVADYVAWRAAHPR